ncbi:MAG: hypothetical protein H6611_09775, partial [Ignavibacteriales bacterium]|nr:hypothetical protein [Ignavibacteriales bacterium]
NKTANNNGSEFLVFYPQREDYDLAYENCIKFVKQKSEPNYIFAINLDYESLLRKIIIKEKLICFKVTGGDELSLSNKDRHLSDVGNKKVMELLAENIMYRLDK